jgi:hypothetical protein
MSTATLTWTNPTTRTDGTALALTDIASVGIYDNGVLFATQTSGPTGPPTTFTTGVLAVGSHSFTVVVNDTTGHSSAPSSNAVVVVAPTLANPSPATGLTATLNP